MQDPHLQPACYAILWSLLQAWLNGTASTICADVVSMNHTSILMRVPIDWLQETVGSLQSNAVCQAMAALLLANIHAPDFKPAITLTDLRDSHSIFWLDGFTNMYYAAPDAATA